MIRIGIRLLSATCFDWAVHDLVSGRLAT